MPGGSYSAMSGMRSRMDELDRLAGDLANISTPGYKVERAGTESVEREAAFSAALDSAVDVVSGLAKIDFKPGVIATTGRDLDAAIEGPGFFVIDTPAGERYTRAGAFTRRADGVLTTGNGEPVLGESGEITLSAGAAKIDADGTVKSGATVLGKLRIVEFASEKDIARESGSRFRAIPGATPQPSENGRLVSGSLEQSNANVVEIMARLTEVTRGFESLQRGVTTLTNELDGRAITELTRR
jgi:flagellar basal-body rod protein FlgF